VYENVHPAVRPAAPPRVAEQSCARTGRDRSDRRDLRLGPKVVGIAAGQRARGGRLEHSRQRALALQPVDRDTFPFARITARFVGDEAGNAVAPDGGKPVPRNVRFTRAGDAPTAR
jgi:hypothetical protein